MSIEDTFYWYKLFNIKYLGNKGIRVIYDQVKKNDLSLKQLFNISETDYEKYFSNVLRENKCFKINYNVFININDEEIYNEFIRLRDRNINFIYLDHKDYPKRLLGYKNYYAPPVLFYEGNINLINAKSIAIIGSRNASEEGLKIARWLSTQLAREGINIISGYAKGIDTEAHRGALEVKGTTTIILSYGISKFKRKKLLDEIKWQNNYLVISEFSPEETWKKQNAMIRNKLVCALSNGVVVVESENEITEDGRKSGTFDTAKEAIKLGIPLFVISPGEFKISPKGNDKLIKIGGNEVTKSDVVEKIVKIKDDKNDITIIDNKKKGKKQLSLFEE